METTMRYPITLTPDDNGTFLVTCPILPEVTTFGEDEADAIARAKDAILTAMMGRVADRQIISVPTSAPAPFVDLGPLIGIKIQLHNAMVDAGVRKAEMTRRLGVHPPQVDRLLDFDHGSTLDQLDAAMRALGRRIEVTTKAA